MLDDFQLSWYASVSRYQQIVAHDINLYRMMINFNRITIIKWWNSRLDFCTEGNGLLSPHALDRPVFLRTHAIENDFATKLGPWIHLPQLSHLRQSVAHVCRSNRAADSGEFPKAYRMQLKLGKSEQEKPITTDSTWFPKLNIEKLFTRCYNAHWQQVTYHFDFEKLIEIATQFHTVKKNYYCSYSI